MKQKSKRNKTIDFGLDQAQKYLKNAIYFTKDLAFKDMINKNIIGDTFEVLKNVEDEYILHYAE